MADPIPFTREELARELEDANRLLEVRRLRIEALEECLRSMVSAWQDGYGVSGATHAAIELLARKTSEFGLATGSNTAPASAPMEPAFPTPQPAGGEAPERIVVDIHEGRVTNDGDPVSHPSVSYTRSDLHAAALARAEAAEAYAKELETSHESIAIRAEEAEARDAKNDPTIVRLTVERDDLEKALRALDAAVSSVLCEANVVIAPVVRESLGRALRSARGTGSR